MIDPFSRRLVSRDIKATQYQAKTRNHSANGLFINFIITARHEDVGNSLALASKTMHGDTEGEQTTPDGADE
jgi:hypothetical protein